MVDYVGQQLGNYLVTHLIGEGAFAQVYLGEHIYLGTQAAIKVLHAQAADSPMDWFRTEARTIARLIHPNIVRVLEFGVLKTTPFLVLDYAPGGSLRQRYPAGTLLPLPAVVSYTRQAAEALQYVHDERLVHRDVKPENLLLGRRNEVLLSDFGIALLMQTFRSRSVQDVAGTLAYMAPEQIQGQPSQASDQYSLGIIAYEWLGGKLPFTGSLTEVLSQHLMAFPPSLRSRVPTIPPAVEQVVMKALEKDIGNRFESVRAFARALEQASQSSNPPLAQAAGMDGETAVVLPSFRVDGLQSSGDAVFVRPPAPSPSAYSIQARSIGTIVSSYRGHLRAIRSLSWSPDSTQIVSTSDEKTAHVWDALTGRQLQLYQDSSDAVRLVAWSLDGSLIATVGADEQMGVWNFATGRLITTYSGHRGSVINALSWSPGQHLLASASADGTVHVWDALTGQTLCMYRSHSGRVSSLAWSPNSPLSSTDRAIVSGGDDAIVHTWEATTGKNIALYSSHPARIISVAWSPSVYSAPTGPGRNPSSNGTYSSRVACGREDGMIEMWDTTTQQEALSYRYSAPISVVAWSPNGRRFAYASPDNNVEVWDTSSNLKLLTYSAPAPLRTLSWSPDGKYIATGADDATIQVWIAP
ncbi:MAG: protein kinase [Ktedonobacteraceae bacterium]|nr:protein kinase [Ktedonobacteraceae bacterium]